MISLAALSCRLGGRPLLEDITLDLAAGCVAVIGPNGAGKSTLLQVCADGARHLPAAAFSGAALLDGRPLRRLPADTLAQRRSFLPQQHADSLHLPVEAILELATWPHGGPASQRARLDDAAVQWSLAALLPRPYDGLSGGERQRVQLARTWLQMTLAPAPARRLWLLDEPQNGLDLPHQQRLREILRREADSGALVVFSTHDLNLALRTADTLVALRDGRLHYAGPAAGIVDTSLLASLFGVPFEVLSHPADGRPWLVPR